MDGVTVDGSIYAVPTDKELAPTKFALFDTEKIKAQGYDLSKVENFEDTLALSKQYYEDTGIEGTYIDKGWLGANKLFEYDCVPSLDYQVCLDTENPEEGYKWLYEFDEYRALAEEMNGLINEGVIATKLGELYDWKSTETFILTQDGLPTSEAVWKAKHGRNYDKMLLLDGEPDDTREIMVDFNDQAIVSPALGFTPDLSEYQAQVANILNINNKYNTSLMNFIYSGDLDSMLEPAIEEYKSVGGQDVIDEVNRQYEEWQATQ